MEATALPVYFGEWLKHRRKALDLTQAELAQRAGCSVFAVRKIESGERRPSKQLAGLLAQCLEIPPEDQATFIRVARGELNLERLPSPNPAGASTYSSAPKPISPPNNLPVMPTLLVGRQPELVSLERLLGDPHCRLLTLVGPGGVGKTRLAVELVGRHPNHFRDGVCFVSLTSVGASTFLVPAIAAALGFTLQGQVEPRLQLLDYLQARQALLVLDNVEHLLDGVGLFAEILQHAPGLKLLVTSRARLDLQSEWVFEVQGLPVPTGDQDESPETYPSIALFLQRAMRVKADFELRPEELPSVVHICHLLEGLPLGIELAAAWVSTLTCSEIAQEIERNLDFLTTAMRDVPERQRSLRAAFDHSWNLLSPDERQALSRLAVFQGGFDRRAAGQVADAALPGLLTLVSKSLLRRTQSGRYDLHQVIRQYALSHLAEDARREETLDRHSDFYLSLLRDREQDFKSVAQPEALRELTVEIDNLRAAWAWAVERRKFLSLGPALRCYAWLCDTRGWLREGLEHLEWVVQGLRGRSNDEGGAKVLGQALAHQGLLYFRRGEHARAGALLAESLALLRPTNDVALLSDPLIFSGIVKYLNGEFDRARLLLEEGLACSQAVGDQWFSALAIFNLGYMASCMGSHAQAYEQMKAALEMWRGLGDPRMAALALNFLAPVAIQLRCYAEAGVFLQESLSLTTRLDDHWGMGTAYRHLGALALHQGDIPAAQSWLQTSLRIFTHLGARWDIGRSLVYLAEAFMAAGDAAGARRIFLDAIPPRMQASPIALDALTGLAHLYDRCGDIDAAFELSLLVLAHPASTPEAKDRAGRLHAGLKARISSQQIQVLEDRARTHTLESIVEQILEMSSAPTPGPIPLR